MKFSSLQTKTILLLIRSLHVEIWTTRDAFTEPWTRRSSFFLYIF